MKCLVAAVGHESILDPNQTINEVGVCLTKGQAESYGGELMLVAQQAIGEMTIVAPRHRNMDFFVVLNKLLKAFCDALRINRASVGTRFPASAIHPPNCTSEPTLTEAPAAEPPFIASMAQLPPVGRPAEAS